MASVVRQRRAVPLPASNPNARVSARVVLVVIALGAVAVLALWWQATPNVIGLGGYLTGAGQILGLMAGYGVVVLVALMARLPPLERGIGTDRLARWHATGGRYVVCVIAGHGVAIIWGYAVTAHTDVVSQAGSLLTTYPDVLMATVAGVMMLLVGVVSVRAARRRMGYETWYYLHLYTYLAIALAFSHQFADGESFTTSLAARFCVVRAVPVRHRPRAVVPDRGAAVLLRPAPLQGGRRQGGRTETSSPSTSAAPISASSPRNRGSSSAGGSSTGRCGGSRSPTPCPPPPARICFGSR